MFRDKGRKTRTIRDFFFLYFLIFLCIILLCIFFSFKIVFCLFICSNFFRYNFSLAIYFIIIISFFFYTESDTKLLYWVMLRLRMSAHGPRTRSNLALSSFTHFNGPRATTVAALGLSSSRAISPVITILNKIYIGKKKIEIS